MSFDNGLWLMHGDCLERMKEIHDGSVDSIVTDPPYGLSFMGKKWDYDVPSVEIWAECLRVLKPGGHLLAFAGTRTQHRMAVRIEDAGFEIRVMIAWVYGSGFPKSMDVSKQIDKAAGAERGTKYRAHGDNKVFGEGKGKAAGVDRTPGAVLSDPPATEAARQWQGWGTALKPALEPITVARKPLIGTVAENVLTHGTGALNIDGCRVGDENLSAQWDRVWNDNSGELGQRYDQSAIISGKQVPDGRWPANLIHDGSDEVLALFPMTSGAVGMTKHGSGSNSVYGKFRRSEMSTGNGGQRDSGSAARFFYCAKASKKDRNEGLEAFDSVMANFAGGTDLSKNGDGSPRNMNADAKNPHPTVKPTELMAYLCRLVTPPGGVVLDPFMGSGSTGKAAMREGFNFVGIEREAEYLEIARARIEDSRGLF